MNCICEYTVLSNSILIIIIQLYYSLFHYTIVYCTGTTVEPLYTVPLYTVNPHYIYTVHHSFIPKISLLVKFLILGKYVFHKILLIFYKSNTLCQQVSAEGRWGFSQRPPNGPADVIYVNSPLPLYKYNLKYVYSRFIVGGGGKSKFVQYYPFFGSWTKMDVTGKFWTKKLDKIGLIVVG